MKKIILLLSLTLLTSVIFAVNPKHFTFDIGSGGSFAADGGTIAPATSMGFSYNFDETFKGGFSFITVDGNPINTITIAIIPADNITLTMHTGSVDETFGFGLGLGYDFFVKNSGLFTSMGVYIDWFAASNDGDDTTLYDIDTGGVFTLGLRTKVGI